MQGASLPCSIKKHGEYPYYIRRKEFVSQHGQAAISKSCYLLQNDTFNAMIAGNPRALGTTMKKMMRAERTKRTPGNTPCSAAAVLWQAKVHSLTRRSFKISNASSAIPGNGHAETRSVNNVFEVAGVIYATRLKMCMHRMNVSFLDMSHSKSNEYERTHEILDFFVFF
ncbi:hypothetical protein XU18_0092 [Perkinsela sp. CCAP 1560/4]|nr:hypothetical protein XU18_0092 [Perkinsela sp. CCAP 1560/4]|eukprot:KNH09407.1 hypothetical protein XU18_0092 [Perkinsela sp. CCAP 1560/4]